jgi:hypothetical protein
MHRPLPGRAQSPPRCRNLLRLRSPACPRVSSQGWCSADTLQAISPFQSAAMYSTRVRRSYDRGLAAPAPDSDTSAVAMPPRPSSRPSV